MPFNPFNEVKKFINTSSKKATQSYDKISVDVANLATPIVKTIKPDILMSETIKQEKPIKPVEPVEIKPKQETDNLVSFEKQFQSLYVGCYSDDPSNPSMETFLGPVSNISECIDMGREKNFEYVGIRGGNECFASNTIPITQSVNRDQYCNVGCDDIGTGKCGGFYYNQVYKTIIPNVLPKLNVIHKTEQELEIKKLTSNAVDILENFISSDTDMKKITMGLNIDNFNCWKPLNTYVIFIWLIILIFLIYLLFEYLYKKNKEKLI